MIPLRPLDLVEILDGAFATIRTHPKLMLGASAIVVAVSELALLVVQWTVRGALARIQTVDATANPQEILGAAGAVLGSELLALLVYLLAQVFLAGFVTVVVGRAVLGQRVSFGEAWTQIRPRLPALLGLTLLYGLIVTAGVVLLIIPGIWLYALFGLATPALVLEPAPVGRALGRSRELVRGSWWRVFFILLLATIIVTIIGAIIQIPFSLFGGLSALTDPTAVTMGSQVLTAIGATIAGTITWPFASAVRVLLYIDQRMRREGLDIELARVAGMPTPAAGYPGGAPQSW